jgi:hypothetical protein
MRLRTLDAKVQGWAADEYSQPEHSSIKAVIPTETLDSQFCMPRCHLESAKKIPPSPHSWASHSFSGLGVQENYGPQSHGNIKPSQIMIPAFER